MKASAILIALVAGVIVGTLLALGISTRIERPPFQIVQIRAPFGLYPSASLSENHNDPSLYLTVLMNTGTGQTWELEAFPIAMKNGAHTTHEMWLPLTYKDRTELPELPGKLTPD